MLLEPISKSQIRRPGKAQTLHGGNRVAATFGLVLSLPEMLRPIYTNFGFDLPACNGDDSYALPMAATYVLDRDGLIRLAFTDTDYTKRLEPAEIIACLRGL